MAAPVHPWGISFLQVFALLSSRMRCVADGIAGRYDRGVNSRRVLFSALFSLWLISAVSAVSYAHAHEGKLGSGTIFVLMVTGLLAVVRLILAFRS